MNTGKDNNKIKNILIFSRKRYKQLLNIINNEKYNFKIN